MMPISLRLRMLRGQENGMPKISQPILIPNSQHFTCTTPVSLSSAPPAPSREKDQDVPLSEIDDSFHVTKFPLIPGGDSRYSLFYYLELKAREVGARYDHYVPLRTNCKELADFGDRDYINMKDELGQTVLHIAAQYCSPDDISSILSFKANIDAQDGYGYTPAMYAVMADQPENLVILLEKGADYSILCYKCERSALHLAAMYGSIQCIDILISKGCDVNAADAMGLTPLALAAHFRNSDTSAFLLSQGANPFLTDSYNIGAVTRVALTLPTLLRDIFDQLMVTDAYQGTHNINLTPLLADTEPHTSLYHFLIWRSNIGIVEHPVFKHLTQAKWQMFAGAKAKRNFTMLFLYVAVWTIVYMMEKERFDPIHGSAGHMLHLFMYIFATGLFVYRVQKTYRVIAERIRYIHFLKKLFKSTRVYENAMIHSKGIKLINQVNAKHKNSIRYIDDTKECFGLYLDFIIDILLMVFLAAKLGDEIITSIDIEDIVDVAGSCLVSCLWMTCFMKLAITRKTGPFVIFMKYTQRDLMTVSTMFASLFIPAVLVFYKTVYIHEAMPADQYEKYISKNPDNETSETVSRQRRAAAKSKGGSSGSGMDQSQDPIAAFFLVMRMVLGDYDYEDGLRRSLHVPLWWMFLSITWILISCIIVLNLLIALMTDSYNRIFETAELSALIERARFICDLERQMPFSDLDIHHKTIAATSPIKETFDPICDTDKIDLIDERVRSITERVSRLELMLESRILYQLKHKLSTIEESLTLYRMNHNTEGEEGTGYTDAGFSVPGPAPS